QASLLRSRVRPLFRYDRRLGRSGYAAVTPPGFGPRPEQRLDPVELLRRGWQDLSGADPPRPVDLAPAVRLVVHPRADDGDARAHVGYGHHRAVLRDDLDDQISAHLGIPVRKKVPRALVGPKVDVHVAVEVLELDLVDDTGRDRAATPHV